VSAHDVQRLSNKQGSLKQICSIGTKRILQEYDISLYQ